MSGVAEAADAYGAALEQSGFDAEYYAHRSAGAARDLARVYAQMRPYQREQLHKVAARDSIVVLPTGSGKTLISVALAARQLALYPRRLVVFVCNRRPLVEQQHGVFEANLSSCRVAKVRGGGGATTRSSPDAVLRHADVGVAIMIDTILLHWCRAQLDFLRRHVSLLIVDEVHHAPGGPYKELFDFVHTTCPRAMYNDADDAALRHALQSVASSSSHTTAQVVQLLLQPSLLSRLRLPQLLGLTASPAVAYAAADASVQRLLATTHCALVTVQAEHDNLQTTVATPRMVGLTYWPRHEELVLRCALLEVMRCAYAHVSTRTGDTLSLDTQPMLSITFQATCTTLEQRWLRALMRLSVCATTTTHASACTQPARRGELCDAHVACSSSSDDVDASSMPRAALLPDTLDEDNDDDDDDEYGPELSSCLAVLAHERLQQQQQQQDGHAAPSRDRDDEEDSLYVRIEVVRLLRTLSEAIVLLQTLSLTSALAHFARAYDAARVRAMLRCGAGAVRRDVVPLVAQVYAMTVVCQQRGLYVTKRKKKKKSSNDSNNDNNDENKSTMAGLPSSSSSLRAVATCRPLPPRRDGDTDSVACGRATDEAVADAALLPTRRLATRMQLLLCLLEHVAHTTLRDDDTSNIDSNNNNDSSSHTGAAPASMRSFRGILFVGTRVQAHRIEQHLRRVPTLCHALRPCLLLGKNRSTQLRGMTDAQQKDVLTRFRSGDVRLLIATSVAEEGLDVQSCNLVVRYHHCQNLASVLQSRGRARQRRSCFVTFASAPAVTSLTEVSLRTVVQHIHEHAQAVRRLTSSDSKTSALYTVQPLLYDDDNDDAGDDDDDNDADDDDDDGDANDTSALVMTAPWRWHCDLVMAWVQRTYHVRIATIEQRVCDMYGKWLRNVLFLAVLPPHNDCLDADKENADNNNNNNNDNNDADDAKTHNDGDYVTTSRGGVVIRGEGVAGKTRVRRRAARRFCADAHAHGYLQPLTKYYDAIARHLPAASPFVPASAVASSSSNTTSTMTTRTVDGDDAAAHVLQPAVYLCGVNLCACRDGWATIDTMRMLLPHAQRVCAYDAAEWQGNDSPIQLLNELLRQRRLPRLSIAEVTEHDTTTTASAATAQPRVLRLTVRTLRDTDVTSGSNNNNNCTYDKSDTDEACARVTYETGSVLHVCARGTYALEDGSLQLLRAMGVTVLRNVSRAQVCRAMETAQRMHLR